MYRKGKQIHSEVIKKETVAQACMVTNRWLTHESLRCRLFDASFIRGTLDGALPGMVVLYNCSSSLPQGMAFTLEERLQLGIHGLLPPCFLSQDVQVLRVMKSYETRTNPLDKWGSTLCTQFAKKLFEAFVNTVLC